MKKLIFSTATILFISLSACAQETSKCSKECEKKCAKMECSKGKCDKKACAEACTADMKCDKKGKTCEAKYTKEAEKKDAPIIKN